MPNTILKAKTGTTAVLDATSDISSGTISTITIKLVSYEMDIQTPVMDATPEVTGTPLTTPPSRFRHLDRVTGSITLRGFILDGKEVGLNNLPLEDVDVKITSGIDAGGGAHVFSARLTITRVRIRWDKRNVGVPVDITGAITSYIDGGLTGRGVKEVAN